MKILLILLLLCWSNLSGQQISKYVSYKEAFGTSKNLPNYPSFCQKAMVTHIANHYIDKLRERIGSPLYFNSVYRSPAVNAAVGGASTSDHMVLGNVVAFDIDQDGRGRVSNKAVFDIVRKEFPFKTMIWEFGNSKAPRWLHISFSIDPAENELRRVYRAIKSGNRTIYKIMSFAPTNNYKNYV